MDELVKETIEQLKLYGFAPHPYQKGVLVSKKLLQEIQAAAIEGVADVVHAVQDPTYPDNHKAGMRVPKGGSSCANCKYLADNKTDCTSTYFQKWNGSPKIPGKIDEYCSDWYEPNEEIKAGGPGSGRKPSEEYTPEVVDWHNEALRLAREKLGPDAKISDVLQEAAKIQKEKKLEAATETMREGQHKGTLWNHIDIIGFTGPEEEGLIAMLSRVPPELLWNVNEIKSANELKAKHGRYYSDTKTMLFNPSNFKLRQRFGKGDGWLYHPELTVVHEIGHSLYEALPPEDKQKWMDISGWMLGSKPGQSPAYQEKRPGWGHDKSQWTHKAGVRMPRIYSEKNPNECFADCFAFVLLNKGFQMDPKLKLFIDNYIKKHVKKYTKVSIESPKFATFT